jgi:hypothetical protein
MVMTRVFTVASILAYALVAAAAPRHHRMTTFDGDDTECPFVGAQQCDGTGFDTCTPGGEWVYQDCAPGTICQQGWGAAKWHIWCAYP